MRAGVKFAGWSAPLGCRFDTGVVFEREKVMDKEKAVLIDVNGWFPTSINS